MVETRSKKRKRQRLILISSHVSSWPEVPARFESLNDDALTTVLEFVGDKSYRSFGGLNYHCREIYINTPGMTKETFLFGYGPLAVIKDRIERGGHECILHKRVGKGVVLYNRRDVLDWALQRQDKYLLRSICDFAVGEGRIDLLNEVWNDIDEEEDREENMFFADVDLTAARFGKLSVFKWFETKEIDICKEGCAFEAALYGQLHILQWLKEEKNLKLFEGLLQEAGGHLHVLKWLREQEVPWHEKTFKFAALRGNLDVLQWLHDEGCLKPGAEEWLRVNGYGHRILEW